MKVFSSFAGLAGRKVKLCEYVCVCECGSTNDKYVVCLRVEK